MYLLCKLQIARRKLNLDSAFHSTFSKISSWKAMIVISHIS